MEKRHLDRRLAPDGGRGHPVPARGRRRRRRHRRGSCASATTPSSSPIGATAWRDLPVPGRELDGVHAGDGVPAAGEPGRARRDASRARSPPRARTSSSSAAATPAPTASARRTGRAPARVTQLEIMPRPPEQRPDAQPWPTYPMIVPGLQRPRGGRRAGLRREHPASSSGTTQGGCARPARWSRSSSSTAGSPRSPGRSARSRRSSCCSRWASSARSAGRSLEQLGVELDARGNIARDDDYMSSVPGVFVAGDAGRGQSLIVWAIAEGRSCAAAVDR